MDGVKFGAPYAPPLAVAAPPAVGGDPYAARRLGSCIVDVVPERPQEFRSLLPGWLVVMVAVSIGRHGWRSVDDELRSENQ